ncbi:bifunctional enoyl-CoA hydratase/phosphate acetyltransferase [candidate division WOR-3 bacterium]|nr:bifunctional enoyl-CoA hydratase/phosphate acetyltransferase [candidate division WOR-3 bacterium]
MVKSFEELKERAKAKGQKRLVVACAEDKTVLEACMSAMEMELIIPIFVGDKNAIVKTGKSYGISIDNKCIENTTGVENSVKKSVEIIRSGDGDFLLKGMVKTSTFLKGLLDAECGLRTSRRLSHSAIIEAPGYYKLFQVTDGGMNVKPDVKTKIDIIKNACNFALSLGVMKPKVAILAAVEVVNPEMQETVDAAVIKQMGERGQLGEILIDGPLALDLAVSKEACRKKGIKGNVAGDADILIVPDIASGNISAKGLIYLGKAKAAGIILGAKVPVVMLSRADDTETKLNSIALGVVSCPEKVKLRK